MIPASDMHARWLVRKYCSQHVTEAPLDETPGEAVGRDIRTCAALAASLHARVNPIFMREVIRLFEELHEVHAGEHHDIKQNAALTLNNVPDLIDGLQHQINKAIGELLAYTEPMTSRVEDKVPA